MRARETWRLTREEFVAEVLAGRDFPRLGSSPRPLEELRRCQPQSLSVQAGDYHEGQVIIAAAVDRKPVPLRVLADYPGLKRDLLRAGYLNEDSGEEAS